MKKKFVYLAVALATVVSWLYWSANLEFTNTIKFLKIHSNYVKNILISPSNETCQNSPFLIILVTSYVGHVELRSAHRRAMPPELLKSMNISRVFLLAKIPGTEKSITQNSIQDESKTFGDILQGSFLENYRNLTYKHLMGLQWASTACQQASFILKVDDDTVFNLEKTYRLLQNEKLDNTMLGYMLNNTLSRREIQNKWYVTRDEYPRDKYPTYLSGWYYITTPRVAGRLCDEAMHHPKFWIDDILITGLLTESLNVKLKQLPEDFWLEYYELLECCINDMFNKHVTCEHAVGPNGGRNNLIYEFSRALTNCDTQKNCTKRAADKPLKKSCVAYRERNIFSEGKAEVHRLKF